MQNGLRLEADEQQKLLAHSRAITEALLEEINPIAVGQRGQWQQWDNPQLPAKVVAFPSRETVAQTTAFASQNVRDQKSRTSAAGQVDDTPTFSDSTSSPPTNDEGNALNPDAYKIWKPKPVEGEPVTREQFREKLATLMQNLSMPNPKQKHQREPKNQMEELNQWLADPILRAEVMPRVMSSERYTVEFDEQGSPVHVVEVG